MRTFDTIIDHFTILSTLFSVLYISCPTRCHDLFDSFICKTQTKNILAIIAVLGAQGVRQVGRVCAVSSGRTRRAKKQYGHPDQPRGNPGQHARLWVSKRLLQRSPLVVVTGRTQGVSESLFQLARPSRHRACRGEGLKSGLTRPR